MTGTQRSRTTRHERQIKIILNKNPGITFDEIVRNLNESPISIAPNNRRRRATYTPTVRQTRRILKLVAVCHEDKYFLSITHP